MKRKREISEVGGLGLNGEKANIKKSKNKNFKVEESSKSKKEEEKLKQFYKLEFAAFKNGKDRKKKKASGNLDLLNDDYESIKEISELVKEQVKINKCLLRARILLQKVLVLANRLPLLPFVTLSDQMVNNKSLKKSAKNVLYQVKINEEKIKSDAARLLITLHDLLKVNFLKCDIPINEKETDRIDVIYDEEDKSFYENRRKLYDQNTTINERKLFSVIDTWLPYSKKMCLNFFDIMHKITKISSVKTLKTYEHSISAQVSQAMLDLPSTLENSFRKKSSQKVIGEKFYELLFKEENTFLLHKYVYDEEMYYKKFLISAIQILKENQEDAELLKSEKNIYKIKKHDKKHKNRRSVCFDPIPKLINYMEPEGEDLTRESAYDYMDNPGFVDVILSSLFQEE